MMREGGGGQQDKQSMRGQEWEEKQSRSPLCPLCVTLTCAYLDDCTLSPSLPENPVPPDCSSITSPSFTRFPAHKGGGGGDRMTAGQGTICEELCSLNGGKRSHYHSPQYPLSGLRPREVTTPGAPCPHLTADQALSQQG